MMKAGMKNRPTAALAHAVNAAQIQRDVRRSVSWVR
jgi:hypothetical protein